MRSINIDEYRHNYKDFFENFINLMSINDRRMKTTKGAHERHMETLSFLLFLS